MNPPNGISLPLTRWRNVAAPASSQAGQSPSVLRSEAT
jgi:hypothetical protein